MTWSSDVCSSDLDRPSTRGPRRDFGAAERGYDRRPGGDRDSGRTFGGDRRPSGDSRPSGDRPRWQGSDRGPDRREGGFRDRESGYRRDGQDSGPGGYRSGQDAPSRPARPSYGRPGSTDRPAGGRGFSRTMSDRIGGAFPDERAARPPRSGDTGRQGARGTSSVGAGGRTGRTSGYGTRPGADRGRPYDRGNDRPSDGRPSDGRPSGGRSRDERPRGDRRDGGDRRGGSGSDAPRIPDSITDDQVSREVRDELGSLSFDRASIVGRYLVAAELATDPEQAYRYAQAAKQMAARVGIVREVSGVMAYNSGRWAEALTELQAGRRMTGRNDYLPLMADSERGLGRLDRALDLVHSAEAKRLPRAAQIELRIVESGIRRDQGLADAAVLALQVPELTDGKQRPWSARLFYAYGEALLAADRPEAAREAFSRAVVADEDEQTDALARLDELDGISVTDLEDDEDEDDEETADADADADADDLEDEDDEDLDDEDDDDEDDDETDDDLDLDDEEDDPDETDDDLDLDDEEDDPDDESDEPDPLEEDEDFEDEEEVDDESDDDEDETDDDLDEDEASNADVPDVP